MIKMQSTNTDNYISQLLGHYSEESNFQRLKASDCASTPDALITVLKGYRRLAILPGKEYWPDGMRERLEAIDIIIKEKIVYNIKNDDKDDVIIKRNWQQEKKEYKVVTQWIIFRKGQSDSYKEYKEAIALKKPSREYHQKLGEVLSYKDEDIQEFLSERFSQ